MKQFDSVPIKIPAKNVFTLDHDVKGSYNFDKLYPILCQPVYPGDTFNCRAEVFLRAMPLKCPVMHNVDMKIYFFFVPMRLVWNEKKDRDWKTFITGGEDGLQNPDLPFFSYRALHQNISSNVKHGSLLDHMGFPTVDSGVYDDGTNADTRICSLPFRAYQLVWNEYFRNQNVQNPIEFSYDEGEETNANITKLMTFRKKCWEKDYFTSCLPFAQRGEVVRLPIEFNPSEDSLVDMPVTINSASFATTLGSRSLVAGTSASGRTDIAAAQSSFSVPTAGEAATLQGTAVIDASEIAFTGLTMGTINDFRYCLRLQQWLENNARCGSRYIEQLLSHFGVVSSDARLQRPELLGGGNIPLLFTDIAQTTYGDPETAGSTDVLGNLGGKGTLYGKTSGFKKYFEEHGILLGLMCIIPRTSYSQGIPRVWTQFDKTDWYFPEFAHLGEQAVLRKEVYFDPSSSTNEPDAVFGYQGRFTELRYIPSTVHGEMRGDLQYWHLGRTFPSQPRLNASFVTANTRADIFALSDVASGSFDPFVAQFHLDISAVRPLPKYAVPTL